MHSSDVARPFETEGVGLGPAKPRAIRLDGSDIVIRSISYITITLFALFCLLPFVLMLSASLSSEAAIMKSGFGILPKDFSLAAYEWIFKAPRQIIGSYVVTIVMTVFGTAIGLFIISMTGYALHRRDFPFRNHISFFIYFTTLFSAGLAPTFLWVARDLGLRGNYLAVFLQLLMTPWLIILMKNFMRTVPYEIIESGKVDGAGDFRIFAQLCLPMMKPALATIGLFLALGYWNEWYLSSLYLGSTVEFKPLQYHLYNIIKCQRHGAAEQHAEDGERHRRDRSDPAALPVRAEILRQRHHHRRGEGLAREQQTTRAAPMTVRTLEAIRVEGNLGKYVKIRGGV